MLRIRDFPKIRLRKKAKPGRRAPLLARAAHYVATLLPVVIVLAGLSWMALVRGNTSLSGAHAEQTLPHPPVPTVHPRRKSAPNAAAPAQSIIAKPAPAPSPVPVPVPALTPASVPAGPNSATPEQSASTNANAASAAKPPAAVTSAGKTAVGDAKTAAAETAAATPADPSLPPLPTRKPKPKPPTTPEGIFLAAMDKLLAPALALQLGEPDKTAIKAAMNAYKRSKLQTAKTQRDKITDPAARKLVDWYALRVGFGRPEAFYSFLKDNPAWPARKTMIKRAEEQLFAAGGSAASIKSFFKSQPAQTGAGFAAMASAALAQNNKPQARLFAAKAWHELSLASSLETGFIKRFGKLLTIADHRWRIDRLLVNNSRWRGTRRARAAKVRRLIPLLPSKFEQQKVKARLAIYLRQRGAAKLLAAVDKGPPPPPAAKAKTKATATKKTRTAVKTAAQASAPASAPTKKVANKTTTPNPGAQNAAATASNKTPPLPTRAARSKTSSAPAAKPPAFPTPKPVPASITAPRSAAALQLAAKAKTPPKPQPLDWGLQFQRVQLARRQKKHQQAWKILLAAPGDKTKLVNPDAWWKIKQSAVYGALKSGKIAIAARLAANPGPISINPRKDAAFMAGWIAYRHLKDYNKAAAHFKVMRKSADGPLSASKAAFWLARATKHFDKAAASAALADAASFNHTFHGQLARQMIDPALKDLPIKPPTLPTPAQAARFANMDVIKALIIAHKAGLRHSTLRAFLNSLRYYLRAEPDVLMLAHLARRMDDIQMSVRIGKTGVARKLNLYYYSYPTHALPLYNPLRPPPEPAFLLGIARQETEFNTKLKSSAGARGILQVMPITARHVCSDYKIKCSIAQLVSEPSYNTMIGSAYIGDRLRDFRGSYVLTLSGYNAGPGRTRQWIRQFGDPRAANVDVVDWIERIPFTETRKYVMKVLSNIQIYRARLGDQANALQIRSDLMRAKAGTGKPE